MGVKIALVGSSGGHLRHLLRLKPWYEEYERFFVTFPKPDAKAALAGEAVYWLNFPTNRHAWNLIRNFGVAWRTLRTERPSLIVSTGAGGAIPFYVLGKLFGAKLVWIEVIDRVTQPSLTGRIVAPFCDAVIVQWPIQATFFRRAINLGPLL